MEFLLLRLTPTSHDAFLPRCLPSNEVLLYSLSSACYNVSCRQQSQLCMRERDQDIPGIAETEHTSAPWGERLNEELETDLYGLIGDMETDLSFADEAVHKADLPTLLERLQSVVLEASEAIYLVRREAGRRSDIDPPTNKGIE